jgi:hypothetical protein
MITKVLIRATKAVLVSMLDDVGANRSAPTATDVRAVVETFRRFAALPAEDAAPPQEDGDGVLAQFGTYDLRGQDEFSVDLTRQFAEGRAEDAATWQLSCTFYWSASAATDVLASGQLWSFGRPLDLFFDEAVALPGWAWALEGVRNPRSLVIVLDEI